MIWLILYDPSEENITHIAGRYSWSPAGQDELRWQSIPRGTAIKIYKHYFADFGEHQKVSETFLNDFNSVLFGYSPDDVEEFIAASNRSAAPPSDELDNKSRRRLQRLGKDYEKLNEDFICWNVHFRLLQKLHAETLLMQALVQ